MPSGTDSWGPCRTLSVGKSDVYENITQTPALNIPILVKEQNIEPFVLVSGHVHADSVAP